MPSPVVCPKCYRQVSLPARTEQDIWVRCPLCQGEYQLQAAMDFAPPALEVIDGPGAADVAAVPPIVTSRPGGAPSAKRAMKVEPQIDIDDEELALAPETRSEVFADMDAGDPIASGAPLPASATGIATGAVSAAPFIAPPVGVTARAFTPLQPRVGNLRRRSGKRNNALVEVAKIVVGGVLGLAIGYAVLLWIFKVDPFNLAPHLPHVLLPEALQPPLAPEVSAVQSRANLHGQTGGAKQSNPRAQPISPYVELLKRAEAQGKVGLNENPTGSRPPADGSPAEPTSPPQPPPEPEGPKVDFSYSLADVSQAMASAHQSAAALADAPPNSTAAARNELRRDYYIALAKLAETVTLMSQPKDAWATPVGAELRRWPDNVETARAAAVALVMSLADDQTKRDELGRLAAAWINSPQRTRDGIVAFGRVQEVGVMGKHFRATVKLGGQQLAVTVISGGDQQPSPGEDVLVLGTIVTDPAKNLHNYEGSDETVVWAGVVAKCDDR